MKFLPGFLLSIFKAVPVPEKGNGSMYIVIKRPYAYLEKELRRTFKGREDVRILVDKRFQDRRQIRMQVSDEHRRKDRRRETEKLVDVVIST